MAFGGVETGSMYENEADTVTGIIMYSGFTWIEFAYKHTFIVTKNHHYHIQHISSSRTYNTH